MNYDDCIAIGVIEAGKEVYLILIIVIITRIRCGE